MTAAKDSAYSQPKRCAQTKVADLPTIIPLFPLPNLVFFPGMAAPLCVFEPRYREMVAEVSQSHGIVGMMLLKEEGERDDHADPDIFRVGCAARITELVKLADGRYNLVLSGISEFRVVQEIRDRSYRQAKVEWCPVEPGALDLDAEAFEGLCELLARYLGETAPTLWESLAERGGLHGAGLINFLCFHLDVSALEKQTMLEARAGRIDCLFDVLIFGLEERKSGRPGSRGGSGSVQ